MTTASSSTPSTPAASPGAFSRWVHRPRRTRERAEQRSDPRSIPRRIYGRLRHLIELRRQTRALAGNDGEILDTGNGHVFGYLRRYTGERVLVLASFSEHPQVVPGEVPGRYGESFVDLVRAQTWAAGEMVLEPYRFVWLAREAS